MKRSILFLALGFFAIQAMAQSGQKMPSKQIKESEVPPAIMQSFKKMHPNATVDKWEQEYVNYEAEFKVGGVENSVVFGPNGQFLQSEVEIKPADLPKAVTDYCAKNMAGKTIKEAAKITDSKGKVTYEAEVDGTDYIIDENGTLVSKESDTEKDDK